MAGDQQVGLLFIAMILVGSFLWVASAWQESGLAIGYKNGFSDARGNMCNPAYVKCDKPKQ